LTKARCPFALIVGRSLEAVFPKIDVPIGKGAAGCSVMQFNFPAISIGGGSAEFDGAELLAVSFIWSNDSQSPLRI
jgi:hypothetical protein